MKVFSTCVGLVIFILAGCGQNAQEVGAVNKMPQQVDARELGESLYARIVQLEDGHEYAVFQNSLTIEGGIVAMHAAGCKACKKENVAEKE